ncbi:hypothetical protein OHA72_10160 [Dactylosporangium sp. NBC_01737]|uniref:hypothetical protein n=1 Tax=Dactylosporangium sp. NBC_01737 TaxID=2975959 RepID=UPI002E12785A|nr:hypothetical protein OHA72_10160 [Dactylosporangium sp. NBC_01737]
MSPPGEDPQRAGPRSLFPLDAGAVVPGAVVELLRMLGQACNDAGLAVLGAQSQFAYAAEAFWRLTDQSPNMLTWVAEQHYFACRDHVERLTAMYAQAAARYAVCAVEIASRVADGQPAAVPTSLPTLPSDVLVLAQIHVPLLQIPERAVASRQRRRLAVENAGLAGDHQRLTAAMAAVESPATTFDDPDEVDQRQAADLLETEFPSTLHEYATACAFALAIMSVPER